jgi:hypothetical protein
LFAPVISRDRLKPVEALKRSNGLVRGRFRMVFLSATLALILEEMIVHVWKTVLLDPERLERGLDAYLAAEKEKDVGDPEEETRALTIRIAEADRRRAAYQDLVADGLMERDELRAKLDALRRLKAAAEEGLTALEESRRKVRELELSREKVLARYWDAVPEALEKTDGNTRRAVYNTLGVTVWAAKAKGDPIRIVLGALGGEEVCRSDATSTR